MIVVLIIVLGLAVAALGCGGLAAAAWLRDIDRRLSKLEERMK